MNKHQSTRREFLKTATAATAVVAAPVVIPSSAPGNADTPAANEPIVMGGIGLGNMGKGDMGAFAGNRSVEYVAVCDVRRDVREERRAWIEGRHRNRKCAAYNDFRELLARTDIDAVHIATPTAFIPPVRSSMSTAACSTSSSTAGIPTDPQASSASAARFRRPSWWTSSNKATRK